MNRYLEGHRSFTQRVVGRSPQLFRKLAQEGQEPEALVVCCSDSRVIPELIVGAVPGNLFVVRNVANLIPLEGDHNASVSAALHYGIEVLKVKHLVVMGHEGCGGMSALAEWCRHGRSPGPGIEPWLKTAKTSWDELVQTGDQNAPFWHHRLVEENVLQQLANALTYPVVREAAEAGRLTLHAWVYDLDTGKILFWDNVQDKFVEDGAGALTGGELSIAEVEAQDHVKEG